MPGHRAGGAHRLTGVPTPSLGFTSSANRSLEALAIALESNQGLGQVGRARAGRGLTRPRVIVGQGRIDRLGVEQRQRRMAVRAGIVLAQVDRTTAAGAVDDAHACGQVGDLGRAELAHEAFFDHERREGGKAPVLLRAAPGDVAAGAHQVNAFGQLAPATRARLALDQRRLRVVAVGLQLAKQVDHALGRKSNALAPVEPQAAAGVAQVERHRTAVVRSQASRRHGRAAGGAGQCLGGKRQRVVHGAYSVTSGTRPHL